jgi:hypothetical protein
MNLSHRRSASTATENILTSDLQPHRLRAHSNASPQQHHALDPHHQSHPRRKEGEEHSNSGSEMTSSSDDLEMEDIFSADEGLEDDEETGLTSGDRRKRRKRKRKNTLLDQRVVASDDFLDAQREEQERLARGTFWWKVGVNSTLIGMWYLFSISITLVCLPPTPSYFLLCWDDANAFVWGIVQQVDVQIGRRRARYRVPLSALHDVRAHDRAIHPRIACTLLLPAL